MKTANRCVAVIGTGLMGAPMAVRLSGLGYEVSVFNRTKEKAELLASDSISVADEVSQLLEARTTSLLALSDADAIESLLLESDLPLAGHTFIQMGTISPEQSRRLATRFAEREADYLEAPVLGSIPEATDGKLIIMVGGSEAQCAQFLPIFESLGTQIVHVGAIGAAAALKLAMNQLIGSLTTAFSVSLAYIQSQEVPVDEFMSVVRASALYAKTYDKKLPRMLDRDYSAPNFPSKHLLKDMELIRSSAEQGGVTTRSMDGTIEILRAAIDMGLADTDYSAIFQAVYNR